jgi:tetratricopeptide (TPR) repeat protein
LGINYLLCYNYDAALDKLSTAIELNKHDPQFYNYKALALYMTGQYDQSLLVFWEALKIYETRGLRDAEVGECWYNRGNALLNLGREEEALQSFRRTEELPLDDKMRIRLLYAQGRALESRNDGAAIGKFK